jgi:anti-sigma regulatory factor (Ser/Thr protein kinase)
MSAQSQANPVRIAHRHGGLVCDLDANDAKFVRMLVRQCAQGRVGNAVDDAVLVTEELVTNAQRHGLSPRACRLALTDHGRCLRIEVDDASPAIPRIRTPDLRGGRGLILVDHLASAWGVEYHGRDKTVWAEVALGRAGGDRHRPHLSLVPQP